jgi:HD-GYP domain-containing protein (c-di-GMP phosphodiesterase class II)
MLPSNQQLQLTLQGMLGEVPSLALETSWDVLNRFAATVTECQRTAQQTRLVMESVRDSLNAGAVFSYHGSSNEVTELVGDPSLSPAWCRDLACRVLQETPGVDGQLLRSTFSHPEPEPAPSPKSVAMVRISKSQGIWIVALSFKARRRFQVTDIKIMTLARQILLNHRRQTQVQEKLKDTLLGLACCLTATINAREPYTRGHSERVARIAVRLGRHMRLGDAVISDLYLGALLHDIGMIGVRDEVLRHPGPLSPADLAAIKEHTVLGAKLLRGVKELAHLEPCVRNHHERFDGRGYPDGLAGDKIPLLARIVAVADAWDAMRSPRPHRPALSPEQIGAVLAEGAGTQWDPRVVKHLFACRTELQALCQDSPEHPRPVAVESLLEGGTGSST